jgi:hypothetical protein
MLLLLVLLKDVLGILLSYEHPAESLESAPVVGFVPRRVGLRQRFRKSKVPMADSVKSAPSTSAPSNDVPVRTALVKMAPLSDDPEKEARSTTALEKSAPSKLESVWGNDKMRMKTYVRQRF